MTIKVSVHQPTFLPWAGFFNKFSQADLFIILGGVDYDHADYMNRCRMNGGWVTLPHSRGHGERRPIHTVDYDNDRLIRKAVEAIKQTVGSKKNPYRERAWDVLELLRRIRPGDRLLETNVYLIREMARVVGFAPEIVIDFTRSDTPQTKTERLMSIIATHTIEQHPNDQVEYYAGGSATNYLVKEEIPKWCRVMAPTFAPGIPDQSFLVDLVTLTNPVQYAKKVATWSAL